MNNKCTTGKPEFAAVIEPALQGALTVNAAQIEPHSAAPRQPHRASQGHPGLKDKCNRNHKSHLVISTVTPNDGEGKCQVMSHQGTLGARLLLVTKEMFWNG